MCYHCDIMYLYEEMHFSNSRGISSNSFKHTLTFVRNMLIVFL